MPLVEFTCHDPRESEEPPRHPSVPNSSSLVASSLAKTTQALSLSSTPPVLPPPRRIWTSPTGTRTNLLYGVVSVQSVVRTHARAPHRKHRSARALGGWNRYLSWTRNQYPHCQTSPTQPVGSDVHPIVLPKSNPLRKKSGSRSQIGAVVWVMQETITMVIAMETSGQVWNRCMLGWRLGPPLESLRSRQVPTPLLEPRVM